MIILNIDHDNNSNNKNNNLQCEITETLLKIIVCFFCHVTCVYFYSESTLCNCLNVKNSLFETGAKFKISLTETAFELNIT